MDNIKLEPYTNELCRRVYGRYVADPMMTDSIFVYSDAWADRYFASRVGAADRRLFAVMLGDEPIGEVQLKHIDLSAKTATLSIILVNDAYKNKGYGTIAESLMLDYAFDVLRLKTVYADCVKRNTRSRHVLQKVGFVFTHEDDEFYYFRCDR